MKESKGKANCSSCYQTATQLVWTHTAETLKTLHKYGARQVNTWKETQRQTPASDGWTISGDNICKHNYGLDDKMTEDRKVWSKMVATFDKR